MDAVPSQTATQSPETSLDFIREIIEADLAAGKHAQIVVRFPPEPNGYLHIGHGKAICLNFRLAEQYGGRCHLRFDDTNPAKEEVEFVESIQDDVRWLGFEWEPHLYFASDYFEKLYEYAIELIHKGLAYVDSLSQEDVREYRGTPTTPGRNSPYRDRSVTENLELFKQMRSGAFADGACVLRAKIDMASPNLLLRDPVLYRIKRAHHVRTADTWCIYPMYDYAHPISDALEGITHSICTLEYEDHRPLYDWVLDNISIDCHPRQIEFARLNLTYTVMSKRFLRQLVDAKLVTGWDDPRMPTLAGMRRRGYPPAAIRAFCQAIGVTKANSVCDFGQLEYYIRQELNQKATRRMVVLDPIKVVIENYPEDEVEWFIGDNNPENPADGTREIPFSRTLYIERDDFREVAPKKFFRLSVGSEVRLKHAYCITCREVVKDEAGEIIELRCVYDPHSRGQTLDGRVVKGTLHWVSAAHAVPIEARIYDHLLRQPVSTGDLHADFNPESLKVLHAALAEPAIAYAGVGDAFQFLRIGYFTPDPDSTPQKPVFNRSATLKDTWAKLEKRLNQ